MAAVSKEIAFAHHFEGHKLKLMNSLYLQWKDQEYCDLVIVAQNRSLSVHTCVMAAFSPKIVSLLSKQKLQNKFGVLNINMVEVQFKYDVMESIVSAVYTGIFQPPAKLLNEVLLAVRWLKITELIEAVKNYIDVPSDKNWSLIYQNSYKEASETSSALNYSHAALHQESSEIEGIKQQMDAVASSVNVRVPIVNVSLNSHREKSSQSENKFPVTDDANDKLDKRNDWIEICFSNVCSGDDIIEQPESMSESDKLNNNNDKQISVMKLRSTKTLKRRSCQSSEIAQSKRRKELSKANNKTECAKISQQKSLKKKTKENKGSFKSKKLDHKERIKSLECDQVKVEDGVVDTQKSPIKEEVLSDDQAKNKQGLNTDNNGLIKCKKCYAKFTSLDLYQSHIQDHPVFECDTCGQQFLSKFTLSKHVRSVHYGRQYLACRHCNFVARSQVELRKHAASTHNDIKPFPCSYAGCTFTAVKHSQVLKHMIIHNESKEFRCNKCNRTFLRQTGLESHQKACFQLQEFLCDLCGQSFNHIHSMRKHRRAIHFGEKPYKCSVCSNSFGDHRNLHRHMLIHDNSFPYSCPLCKQQFRHSNSLKAHVAAKHKDHPDCIPLNFTNGSLGGVSYKRLLKNDKTDSSASRVTLDRGRVVKKWSCKVEREVISPPEIFDSSTFPGEFLSQPEDSSVDASSSNDLELVMDGAHHVNGFTYSSEHAESRALIDEVSGNTTSASSSESAATSFQLKPQIPSGAFFALTERIKSPQSVPVGLPGPSSLGQSDIQTPPLIPSNNAGNISGLVETHTRRSLPAQSFSLCHPSYSHLDTQKLHQSSQALEKYLSQNRCDIGKSKLPPAPKTFSDETAAGSKSPPCPDSSQDCIMEPAVKSVLSKVNSLWKQTGMERVYTGPTQKCISDFRYCDAGNQLTQEQCPTTGKESGSN